MTVDTFICKYDDLETFLFDIAKAMENTPLNYYEPSLRFLDLVNARCKNLIDTKKEDLIPYALIWDISWFIHRYSFLKSTREEIITILNKIFELPELSEANRVPFLLFDKSETFLDTIQEAYNNSSKVGFRHFLLKDFFKVKLIDK